MNLFKVLLWHFRRIYFHVNRKIEEWHVFAYWSESASFSRGHVSGDALIVWVDLVREVPVLSVWGMPGVRGRVEDGRAT